MSKPQSAKATPFQKALYNQIRTLNMAGTVFQGMYWYTVGHHISAVTNFELGTMYHPIGAGISYTIPNSELGYCVPS